MRVGRIRAGFTVVVLALAACAGIAALLAGPAASLVRSGHAAPKASIRFSHAVVVDQQRPGFEPDVKVAPDKTIYTSVPFGFSTTQSFVWSSIDGGNSYHFVPGTLGPGKPTTCIGGGDTDLYVDPGNALYFSDLQGLTNISDSVSTDGGAHWSTSCDGAPANSPDDRMWYAGTGSLKAGNLTLYQDFDQVESSASPNDFGGNQLVEEETHDGTTFTPVINSNPTTNCLGTATDCVTDNEGISGNQVVDPGTGIVYIAHTTTEGASSGTPGVRVSIGQIKQGSPPVGTWSDSPVLDSALCADPTCVDSSGNPEEVAGDNFATIARDAAGYLYVVFSAAPVDHNSKDANFGAPSGPDQIYVVHTLQPAGSKPSALTWSKPQQITGSGTSAGTNTFPWVTAGSNGRIDVAYYHASEVSEKGTCASGSGTCTLYGPGSLTKAEWSVQMAQSLNANSSSPTYTTTSVSESYIKQGAICTNGIGCTTGGDRSLGDFLQVTTDSQGAAVVSYVFDTSRDTSDGENAGPEVISRQIQGPSLLASVAGVTQNGGPGVPMGSVKDPTGDAYLSQDGTRAKATSNLDLTGASLANGSDNTLIAKIDVKSLSSLSASTSLGGPDASWLIRWTEVTPGAIGNGHIFYVGMDNNQGVAGSSKPSFFVGDTSAIPPPGTTGEHTKYITYPQTKKLPASAASYSAKTGVISLRVPLSDVGDPVKGTVLYSATGFTATSTTPQSSTTIFNLIDATPPFDLVIGPAGTVGSSPTGPKPVTKKKPKKKTCKLSKKLTFRMHPVKHAKRTTKTVVYINGKRVRTVRKHNIKSVTIKRPKKAKFTVKDISTFSNGEIVSRTRTYNGCKVSKWSRPKVLRKPRRR